MKDVIKIKDTKLFLLVLSFILAYISIRQNFLKNEKAYYLLLICSNLLFFIAIIRPVILKPLHFLFATVFKIVMTLITTIILILIFYFVITPIGFFLKLSAKDLLDLKLHTVNSYWHKKDEIFQRDRYLKQF